MKRALVGLVLALGLASVPGCGSDDDSSSSSTVALCKSLMTELCSKFYGCLSKEILDAAPDTFGNNEADCRTLWIGDQCSSQAAKCDSGEKYDSSAGNECLSQFKSLSCSEADLENGGFTPPAACNQVCK